MLCRNMDNMETGKAFAFGCLAKDECSCMNVLQETVVSRNGVGCIIIN